MKKMTQLLSVSIAATLVCSACSDPTAQQTQTEQPQKKPNILLLLADDLGYAELGSYGQKIIKTPELDRMAQEGMRFTNFYAGNAVCSPSRAVLMTGISSSHNTVRGNKGMHDPKSWDRMHLNPEDTTVAEVLKQQGYQTAMIGKWHLDDAYDLSTWAHSRGFDYAIQGQWDMWRNNQHLYKGREHISFLNGTEKEIPFNYQEWNSHDEFHTHLAFEYLDKVRNPDQPFFLYMSYRAPHSHERVIGNKTLYADKGWPENERMHAAKITLLDQQVGRLLKKLDEMGELDNTLVLFTSDNGPHNAGHDVEFFNSNGELSGFKRDVYEGGIRVPLIAYWRGKIAAGTTTDFIAGGQDIMPTLAEAAGTQAPARSDGISILPLLEGKTQQEHSYLNWEFRKIGFKPGNFRQAGRIGNFKGVRYGLENKIQIFDLSKDISEKHDIAQQHPELVKQFAQIFKEQHSPSKFFPYGDKKPVNQ